MAVNTLVGRGTLARTIPVGVILLGLAAGAATAVSPYFTLAAVAGIAVFYLTFLLPARVLLFAFAIVTLSGFRPFPPVFGFHIQAEYFLVVPLLVRAWASERPADPSVTRLWKPLTTSSLLVVGASLFAFGQDVFFPTAPLTTTIGDYVAWVIVFVFLWIFVRLAQPQGADFGRILYRDIVDVLGLFAAYTLVTGLLHFQSFSQASSARLSSTDLNPNETGVIVVAAIILIVAPMAIRGPRLREAMWLPFLLPLLVLTASRESLGALVIGLIFLLFQLGDAGRTIRYLYALLFAGAALIVFLVLDQSAVPHVLLRKFNFPEIVPYTHFLGLTVPNSIAERYYIQATAFHQFLAHPFLGSGFNRGLSISEGTSSADWWAPPTILKVAHDSYLTVAAQQGLLGFIPFIGLVVVAIRAGGRAARTTLAAGSNFELAAGVRLAIFILALQSLNIDALYASFQITMVFFWIVITAILLGRTEPVAAETVDQAGRLRALPELEPLHA